MSALCVNSLTYLGEIGAILLKILTIGAAKELHWGHSSNGKAPAPRKSIVKFLN